MTNPFESIDSRLNSIESLLLDLKQLKSETSNIKNRDEDEILNIQQASVLLNLAKPTIYSLTSNRILPHAKRGKKLYFKKSELLQWIQSGKRLNMAEIKEKAKHFNKAAA